VSVSVATAAPLWPLDKGSTVSAMTQPAQSSHRAVRAGSVLLLAMLSSLSGTGFGVEHAAAASSCDQIVRDSPGDLTRAQAKKLTSAAKALAVAADARVRVRLYPHVPSGDVASAVRKERRSCPDWTKGSRIAPDMIVVAVAVSDQLSGLFYGTDFADRLDSEVTDIRTGAMHDRFVDGDVEGGLQAGLDGVREVLDPVAEADPPADEDDPSFLGGVQDDPSLFGGGEDEIPQSQPAAHVNMPWRGIGLFLAALAVLVALSYLVLMLFRRRARRAAALLALAGQRERAQHTDGQARAAAAATAAEVEQVTASLCSGDAELLQGQLREHETALESAASRWQGSEKTWTPAAVKALKTEAVDAVVREYAERADACSAVLTSLEGLKTTCVSVRNDLEMLPGRIREAHAALDDARVSVARVQSAGLRTPASDESLASAQQLLVAVAAHLSAREVFAANAALKQAGELTARAVASADALSVQVAALGEGLLATRRSRAEAVPQAEAAVVLLASMRQEFDASCWSRWESSVSAAATELSAAEAQCTLLEAAISLTTQRWDDAEVALAQARVHVAAAVTAAEGLGADAVKTKAVQSSLAADSARIEQRIEQALAMGELWRPFIGSDHVAPLRASATQVAGITKAGTELRPPWLQLADELADVEVRIGALVDAARGTMTSMAQAELSGTERASSSASSYLSSHHRHSHRGASNVDRAHRMISEARSLLDSSPHEALRLAKEAASAAADGERAVRSAVRAARAAANRAAAAASAASMASSQSSSFSSSSSSSSDMGGSSGSW
jgi:uncharacterized membrane protein YgcG